MKKSTQLTNLSVHDLNELYLGKHVAYGQYFARIIHIAYYSNLDNVPYCEIQSCLDYSDTKIIPLSKVVLVASVA